MRCRHAILALVLAGISASAAPVQRPSPPLEPEWETSRGRPPVPDRSDIGGAPVRDAEALGDVWEEDEENEWRGVFIRRGQSRLFDAYWVHPSGERVLAVLEIFRRGRTVEIHRRHGDGQGCTYRGTIARNWVDVQGRYSCSWHRHSSPWDAKIIRMRDVSPALLSEGGWRRTQ